MSGTSGLLGEPLSAVFGSLSSVVSSPPEPNNEPHPCADPKRPSTNIAKSNTAQTTLRRMISYTHHRQQSVRSQHTAHRTRASTASTAPSTPPPSLSLPPLPLRTHLPANHPPTYLPHISLTIPPSSSRTSIHPSHLHTRFISDTPHTHRVLHTHTPHTYIHTIHTTHHGNTPPRICVSARRYRHRRKSGRVVFIHTIENPTLIHNMVSIDHHMCT